jgi:hypothetical protein
MLPEDAIHLCTEIIECSYAVPEKASDFADSARETARGIRDNIQEWGNVTDNQSKALENLYRGISKWLK